MASRSTSAFRRWSRGALGGIAERLLPVAVLTAVSIVVWQVAHAGSLSVDGPGTIAAERVDTQVREQTAVINARGAELATASYIPRVGAVFTARLARDPNRDTRQSPSETTREWAESTLQILGPRLDAIPSDETIALIVDFYQYEGRYWRQFALQSRADTARDPSTYSVWLDGRAYVGATDLTQGTAATPRLPDVRDVPFGVPGGPSADWLPVSGAWTVSAGAYEQTRLDDFDFTSFLRQPLRPPYQMEVSMRFVAGRMGGGLVFAAPTSASKLGAHMVGYSENGSLLQFGWFDAETGAFQYQGGVRVASGTDGRQHQLLVDVGEGSFNIVLDGQTMARNVPLPTRLADGYAGLLASTSHVRFERFVIRQIG